MVILSIHQRPLLRSLGLEMLATFPSSQENNPTSTTSWVKVGPSSMQNHRQDKLNICIHPLYTSSKSCKS